MPISWNEIRHNAIRFAHDWAGATSEAAEKQTFWNEFFDVFGIRRRVVASFEEPVRQLSGKYGHIDLFWKRTLLVEHKSRGQKLGKAESQAFEYIQDLINEGRADEVPQYVIVSDFARIALHDLEPEDENDLPLFQGRRVRSVEFPLADLHKHIHAFAFIPGYKQHRFEDQDPINLKATEIMGHLHDTLEAGGYQGHQLERLLVRILFCLFAEDTGLFDREAFRLYVLNRTAEDGSDLGLHLTHFFRVLDTPEETRQKNLDETLASFPYVNGDLFREHDLEIPEFNRDMRNALLACTRFDWSAISPAIFGSLFQAVMEPRERRQTGGHYTSERDILKVIRSLFLDDLRAEFERIRKNKAELRRFHERLSNLRFLDPACGCGNFLVITYRELRQLELELLKLLYGAQRELTLDVNKLSKVDVDQFYGIEIGEWPARIAEVALWLMDHQMNIALSEAFGQRYVRLPLKKSPHIQQANALRTDWKQLLPPEQCSFVLGNPPFVGAKEKNPDQRADVDLVWADTESHRILDYVAAWYRRAAEYIRNTTIKVGFVSTNSITQGEQVGVLWPPLFQRFNLTICFAHRTFPWMSEAKGKAHVHVVIIGLAALDPGQKRPLFDYSESQTPTVQLVTNINPYLVEGRNIAIPTRSERVSEAAPEMTKGSEATDDGHLLLTDEEKAALLERYPAMQPSIKPFTGGREYINGIGRWCLWLLDTPANLIRSCPPVLERLQRVRDFRRASPKERTRSLADTPGRFGEIRQPTSQYLMIPKVSSERRKYIPIGFLSPDVIANGSALVVPNASLYHFGILSSLMHMGWMRQICGRMKSDYQYSVSIVYNNFPWPDAAAAQRKAVELATRHVLEVRRRSTGATLADLYDPLSMPPALVKAHAELDRAVDLCYRSQPFTSERQRVEFLFALYEQLTTPLLPTSKPARKRPAAQP
ncbi:MAG: SAM-dependent methyltransferase [Verrucomicrobia bacterium]|nr:MAG: SAM-dependent methyltransferase [Verrucomicrobiota bacterium]